MNNEKRIIPKVYKHDLSLTSEVLVVGTIKNIANVLNVKSYEQDVIKYLKNLNIEFVVGVICIKKKL